MDTESQFRRRITVPARKLIPAFAAAFIWSVVGILSILAFRSDSELTSYGSVFVRALVNLAFVVCIHRYVKRTKGLPWGNRSPVLWLWGFLGAATIVTFFASIRQIGAAEASLLQGAQGVLVGFLAPAMLRQRRCKIALLASILGLIGLFVFFGKNLKLEIDVGRVLGLSSGLLAGFAYLILAREKNRHSAETIGFYWCIVSLAVVSFAIWRSGSALPHAFSTWGLLVAGGILASMAQWLTAQAYAQAPASLVATASYLIPAFGLPIEWWIFGKVVSLRLILGATIIIMSGLVLPFLSLRGVAEKAT